MYFKQAGRDNTEQSLQIAKDEALKRGIKYIVVASTFGDTGLRAAQMLHDTDIKLIIVGHGVGMREPGLQRFDQGKKKEIESISSKT